MGEHSSSRPKRSKRSISAKQAWAKRKADEFLDGGDGEMPSPDTGEGAAIALETEVPRVTTSAPGDYISLPKGPAVAYEEIPPPPAPVVDYLKLQEEEALLKAQIDLMYGLPHLHGWKWYPWAREFFESREKMNFLCAANQISKSSTQIRKAIHWATAKDLWPQLWHRAPSQFWYLYPSQEVVNAEFALKWEREFLPRGKYKDDPVYGWKAIKDGSDVKGIRFNSGVYLFFRTYTKNVQNLQTGTCDAIFCDEELPEALYSELSMRLNATDGYFHMVFTATLGQEIWRLTMEPTDTEKAQGKEMFPQAKKWTISLYEACQYEDGSPSHWTQERIAGVRAKCKSHQEVLKRVYGRFIVLEGRKYPTFDASKHVQPWHPLPAGWLIYCGVDCGSGGEENHPAAIVFVGVRPDFRAARVFLGWRGDGEVTTNGDVVEKYLALEKKYKIQITSRYYDHGAKDFDTISTRMHTPFLKADKAHEKGESLLNTLFKFGMLLIYEDADGELPKLAQELSTLREGTLKRHAKDDFIDALRYALSQVPFDLSGIVGLPSELEEVPEKPLTPMEREIAERRAGFNKEQEDEQARVDQEIEEFNALAGT